MQVHKDFPIGATVRNPHNGKVSTIKEHGCTSSTGHGVELMLWMEDGSIWKSCNVEIVPVTARRTAQPEMQRLPSKHTTPRQPVDMPALDFTDLEARIVSMFGPNVTTASPEAMDIKQLTGHASPPPTLYVQPMGCALRAPDTAIIINPGA